VKEKMSPRLLKLLKLKEEMRILRDAMGSYDSALTKTTKKMSSSSSKAKSSTATKSRLAVALLKSTAEHKVKFGFGLNA